MMNINKNALKKIFRRKDGDPKRQGASPYRDWGIMFTIFSILLAIAIGGHIFMFFGVKNGTLFQADVSAANIQKKLNTSLLDSTTEFFANKKAKFNDMIGVVPGVSASSTASTTSSITK